MGEPASGRAYAHSPDADNMGSPALSVADAFGQTVSAPGSDAFHHKWNTLCAIIKASPQALNEVLAAPGDRRENLRKFFMAQLDTCLAGQKP